MIWGRRHTHPVHSHDFSCSVEVLGRNKKQTTPCQQHSEQSTKMFLATRDGE